MTPDWVAQLLGMATYVAPYCICKDGRQMRSYSHLDAAIAYRDDLKKQFPNSIIETNFENKQ